MHQANMLAYDLAFPKKIDQLFKTIQMFQMANRSFQENYTNLPFFP